MNILKSLRQMFGIGKKREKAGNGLDRDSGEVPAVIDPIEAAACEAEAQLEEQAKYQTATFPGFHLKTERLKKQLKELKEDQDDAATHPAG